MIYINREKKKMRDLQLRVKNREKRRKEEEEEEEGKIREKGRDFEEIS